MNAESLIEHENLRAGKFGFYGSKRGLIEVSGAEAVRFLNGLITNDTAKLESYEWMHAAFPNAQGRTLAVARVLRFGEKFLFETEEATREKVFNNLFRFTFAGDFFVEDLSERYSCVSLRGNDFSNYKYKIPNENEIFAINFREAELFSIKSFRSNGIDVFVPHAKVEEFVEELSDSGAVEIGEGAQEILRIESGVPLYGVDADETTIVSELGIEDLISYKKGCYIGQEIIARIHFRGHVAKRLTGLVLSDDSTSGLESAELKSLDGKNAGRITSAAFSPALGKTIALAFVRYDYLAEGTLLKVDEKEATVKTLPFVAQVR